MNLLSSVSDDETLSLDVTSNSNALDILQPSTSPIDPKTVGIILLFYI